MAPKQTSNSFGRSEVYQLRKVFPHGEKMQEEPHT